MRIPCDPKTHASATLQSTKCIASTSRPAAIFTAHTHVANKAPTLPAAGGQWVLKVNNLKIDVDGEYSNVTSLPASRGCRPRLSFP